MEILVEIVRRPEKYDKAADAMSGLPQKATDETNEIVDVDDDITAYRIVVKMSQTGTALEKDEDEVGLLSAAKELMKKQANDVLCQNLNKVPRKDGTISVNGDGLLRRKSLANEAIQIIVLECYRRTLLHHRYCPTLAGHPRKRKMYVVLRKTYY